MSLSSKEPVYLQTMQGLREFTLSCPYGEPGLMPAEGRLMEIFGVSRGTLRRASDQLVREGLLRPSRGRGTFVNRRAQVRATVRSSLAAIARPDSRWHLEVDEFVPEFDGIEECVRQLVDRIEYRSARHLFVTPDNSTERVRRRALDDGKVVVVSTYGQRRGMVLLDPAEIPPERRELASTLDGMERCGQSLSLDDLRDLPPIELIVTGAFAVTPQGIHVDSNADYFDLEWGLLAELNLVSDATRVVALVHAAQVIDVPLALEPHEIALDLLITSEGLIATGQVHDRPKGVAWEDLADEVVETTPYLRQLAPSRGRAMANRHLAEITWALAAGKELS